MDLLIDQVHLADGYHNLRRPKDGIPLVVDALGKGEKIAVAEWRMKRWRFRLVRHTRAIKIPSTSPMPPKLAPWHDD